VPLSIGQRLDQAGESILRSVSVNGCKWEKLVYGRGAGTSEVTGMSVLLAARSLRRLNPVELLREE